MSLNSQFGERLTTASSISPNSSKYALNSSSVISPYHTVNATLFQTDLTNIIGSTSYAVTQDLYEIEQKHNNDDVITNESNQDVRIP